MNADVAPQGRYLPARPSIDVALALAITGLGIVILFAPSFIPGSDATQRSFADELNKEYER